jgi:arginine-tRNA-protein transferase
MNDVQFHQHIKGTLLDKYLELGWYRTGFLVFTTHLINPFADDRTLRVFWLRYRVPQVVLSKKTQRILEINASFTVSIRPLVLTSELIDLHKKYVASVAFDTINNLEQLLGLHINTTFSSMVIEVRDHGKLIAAGIFDVGLKAIAGIINFYDPAYKKNSLGKFTMLLKYQFCLRHHIPYYYPGYYSIDHSLFDYKLFIDKNATEVLFADELKWIPYPLFDPLVHTSLHHYIKGEEQK